MKAGGIYIVLSLILGGAPWAEAYRIPSEAEARARQEAAKKIQTQGEPVARKESEDFQKRASQARASYAPYFASLLRQGPETPENQLKRAQEQERAYWDSEKNALAREESERERALQKHARESSSSVRGAIERGRASPQKVARLVPARASGAPPKKTSLPGRTQKPTPFKRPPPAPVYELDGSEIPQYLEFPGKKSN